ncbi:hypothetical protein FXV77_21770 [Sphingobacterium phlebotomi]|uniref:Uncharacterized protein n=1 Tax=Sphingobacterium phlebotomi TaxID=2605433 RepID=A0A5D4GPZ0_9SPHI|nr:hypothetical protein [Sphingobacterium phlebotomi]TYR30796.1 hypothetical protein FXV77_21770 [Sphingobacterium phlebotomi]
MKRVATAAAENPGSVILNTMPEFIGTADQGTSQMMIYNRQWILQQMRSGVGQFWILGSMRREKRQAFSIRWSRI